jgi:hypothetical protein
MVDPTEQYLENAARFSTVVRATEDWDAQSPCDDWKAREVVDQVVDTQRDFLATREADLGERPEGSPLEVWQRHLEGVQRLLEDRSLVTSRYDGYFGPTTVEETLATFYGFDLMVHRWDLGLSNGREITFEDAEMDALERDIGRFGPSLYSEGICKPPIEVPEGSSRQTRILGRLGRAT